MFPLSPGGRGEDEGESFQFFHSFPHQTLFSKDFKTISLDRIILYGKKRELLLASSSLGGSSILIWQRLTRTGKE